MKWEILSQNKTFSSDSDLDFLHSSWHSLPAFNKVCSGSYQAKRLSVPLSSLTFSCSWCHWPDHFPRIFFPFSDSDVFWITFCGLVTLLSYFESHLSQFITFCHILNHILSSYDRPPAFCEDVTNTCPWSTSTHFLLVSCYCYPQIQIYLIYVDGSQTCLPTPGHFDSIQTVVWGCFSDRSDWHLDIGWSQNQNMTNVNIFHCCIFWSLFKVKVMKQAFVYLANPLHTFF